MQCISYLKIYRERDIVDLINFFGDIVRPQYQRSHKIYSKSNNNTKKSDYERAWARKVYIDVLVLDMLNQNNRKVNSIMLLQIANHFDRDILVWLAIKRDVVDLLYLLFWACDVGSLEIIKIMIELKCDLNQVDERNHNAIMRMAQHNYSDNIKNMFNIFVADGVSVDVQSRHGESALMMAIGADNREYVDLLIKSNCRLDLVNNAGSDALIYAARTCYGLNKIVILRMVADAYIAKKIKLNNKNRWGKTALIEAIISRNKKAAEYLVDCMKKMGCSLDDVDNERKNAYSHAINQKWNDLIKKILSE